MHTMLARRVRGPGAGAGAGLAPRNRPASIIDAPRRTGHRAVATRRTTTDARVAWMDGLCALFSLHDSHWCVTHHDTACTFVAAGLPREDMFCLCTVRETYPLEAGWLPQRCKLSQVFFSVLRHLAFRRHLAAAEEFLRAVRATQLTGGDSRPRHKAHDRLQALLVSVRVRSQERCVASHLI